MNKKFALLFPGQGAQYPGMGKDFYDLFPAARAVFEEADAILSTKFSDLIFNGAAEELKKTKNSQLSIFIMSIALLRCFEEKFSPLAPQVVAGLSLGEFSALVAAKKLSFRDALLLVKARAEYMNEACLKHKGAMSAVLGLEAAEVEAAIAHLENVWVANLNCPLQVVISGTPEGVEMASQLLKQKGAKRALPLEVSGAFHSGLMKEAQERLKSHVFEAALLESEVDLVMNVPGGYVSSIEEIRSNMILQVTHPVRWEQGIRAMVQKKIDLFIEIGPGKTLTGMNKKIAPSVPVFNLEKVADLNILLEQFEVIYASA
ncbi:MAG TPA: ACP S-malonyltransferase [Rhabdochlamydiaceae bacterium]|nr:ACP S-malonyltransferase [Rhabdochlamydiaceae bacterium]